MDWLQAVGALKREPVRPVYALVGTEPFLVRRFVRLLAERMGESGALPFVERHRFDEEGCAGAIAACQTPSLFSEASIVVLEQVYALTSVRGNGKVDLTPLEAYLDHPVPDRVLVLTVEADKLDERKRASKLLKKHRIVDCHPPKDADAQRLLRELADELGLSIEVSALKELWRRCRMLTLCRQELDKLSAYAAGGRIDAAMVAELVAEPVEDNVFHWVEGVLQGKAQASVRIMNEMRMRGTDALSLLALIAHRLRLIGFVRIFQQQGMPETTMAARLHAHPFAVKQAARMAATVSLAQIEQLLLIVADAEHDIKSGRADADLALEWVVMACLASSGRAAWAR
ncbi:DNA polymerase III subunit delta [Alicyclobacillus kakegawensis]|uniref:DNA polymerase III subunit delta n=1 Tax=Alicyclobacillus kakegawensis TaxID=392012 RepID=UPI000837A23C|nr:DNA polymerase III subunit delta [Alicyclobacillus kakegawensis]